MKKWQILMYTRTFSIKFYRDSKHDTFFLNISARISILFDKFLIYEIYCKNIGLLGRLLRIG